MRRVKKTPIGTDAAFHRLPRLIDRFNDVVVDAIGLGAVDEVADDRGLLHAAGIGFMEIVPRARPAEFSDDDALAGMHLAQLFVELDRVVYSMGCVKTFPIG